MVFKTGTLKYVNGKIVSDQDLKEKSSRINGFGINFGFLTGNISASFNL